ncbi:hypothetical protein AVEN_16849-1 [Araneus ventricosus]|uniref:Uncharacterized protein n=1 Tax=Araneus ventricosus TaxID=182803 RepID=A0A4Y2MMN0_ARAVE|nr:hypothetical protein AVEN_16849-1 [Araneus ventricosus]
MVNASASEPVYREFYSRLCSYSVFAIICNEFDAASLLQVRPMVTSKFALTCCKLVSHLHSCRVKCKFAASWMQTKIAIWDSVTLKIQRLMGLFPYPGWVGSVSPFDRGTLMTFSRPKEGV